MLLSAMTILTSCEKVMDIKLDEDGKKIVIDAVLTDEAGGCVVKLSQTKNFSESNAFNGLGGATISITDNAGNSYSLPEEEKGVYSNPTLKGLNGITYELKVIIGGQTFSAQSTMSRKISLDSIYAEKQFFFDEEETFAHVVFNDPPGTRNYYRFKQFVNGKKSLGNFIMDDEFSDGKQFQSTLYFFPEEGDSIRTGDEIRIEMQCIDKAVYKYWYSYEQSATGSSQSAAPANPVTNIEGGALGYFSAHTVEVKKVHVP